MGQLDGRIAIVTGAAKGLGRAVAQAYADEGATVVVSDIDEAGARAAADAIGGATARACDVTDAEQVAALVGATVDEHGGLDIMVPNAGIAIVKPLVMTEFEEWRRVLDVNLDGVFHCVRQAAPAMVASGGGTIVTMCSITAFAGSPLIASYAAAKAGVLSLTRTAAVELRDQGVRVNAICPGFVGTDLVNERKEQFEEYLDLPMPFDDVIAGKQGRYGEPEEVARLAVFLASDRSRFNSGCAYVLDGGALASLL
jgi:NAD(P)-dependent dehydrogenase (short-subunit alcohol dehydrogenase family)